MKFILCILVLITAAMADSNVEQLIKAGNDRFTAKMFQEAVKAQAGKSVVLSAFSVLSPLSQLTVASVGPSHDELLNAIGMPNDNVTKEAILNVNTQLSSVKKVELKQANKVYISTGYTLKDEFAVVSKNVFNSELQNIDFSDKNASAKEINQWVEDHTNKRIKNLVDPSSITPDTLAVLVNAIYFNAKWKIPFSKYGTRDDDFYLTKDKKVTIPIMHVEDDFKYSESSELNAKILELPYEGDETSFVVVLPNEVDGIDSLVVKLKDPEAFTKCLEAMSVYDVYVSLPKFKIETTTNLKQALKNMNVTKLFTRGVAQLDNLIQGENNLYVSDAIQKTFIEVNEDGTEAAASNKFILKPLSAPEEFKIFKADHPFVFFLMQKNIILFNGVFRF